MDEKSVLGAPHWPTLNLMAGSHVPHGRSMRRKGYVHAAAASAFVASILLVGAWLHCSDSGSSLSHSLRPPWSYHQSQHSNHPPQCAQVAPLKPSSASPKLDDMDEYLGSQEFRDLSVKRLSGAVQIPTPSFDNMGDVGDDPRWDVMTRLAEYLEHSYPLVHETLEVEHVNTHGLLYTWKGSDPNLKPTLLMAHQDVVPVDGDTLSEWKHPPWSGYFDGKKVWGRGSTDCKNNLIGILSAVEALIDADYSPRRTLLLSFGFDEEVSGMRGASSLAKVLTERYGDDSIAVIVDEGGEAAEGWGETFAVPGVAEKGYLDVEVVVRMPGGHSSVPPRHNGIGVMAELVIAVEDRPYSPRLHEENPFLGLLHCADEHAPEFPDKMRRLLRWHDAKKAGRGGRDKLAEEAARTGGDVVKYLFTTSVAADLIHGGVKVNALPERTVLTVNHRINVGETSADVMGVMKDIASKIASRHNLTVHAFDAASSSNRAADEPSSSIILRTGRAVLEPAPVTPTSTKGTSPYSVLAGTTRALYGDDLIVSPGLMTGNTDTRHYWGLTRHIFRYGPGYDEEVDDIFTRGIHTVNEHVSIKGHVRGVQWYSLFVRNMDDADLE